VEIAGKAIELGHNQRGLGPAGFDQRRLQHWATVQCIGPLARLDLNVLPGQLDPLHVGKPGDGGALRF